MKKLVTFLLAGVVVMAVSCSEQATQAPQSKTYKTMRVSLSDKSVSNSYSATIRGQQYVEIRPQVSGVITKILFNEGASLRKGQTLFVIDQVPYKAALATAKANVQSAEAALATAELNLSSSRELFSEGVVADYDVQSAENSLKSAQAALAQAQAQRLSAENDLSYTEVKSPVSGLASMTSYRVGALVSSSITDPLVSVSDDDAMNVYFSMTEAQVLSLMRINGSLSGVIDNMPEVNLILNDGSDYPVAGKIDAISGSVDQGTGAVQLRARFDNPDGILRNGGSGRVILHTQRQDVVVLPKTATFELQNKIFVYKVVDGKTKAAPIKVFEVSDGNSYIVESGVDVGDVIIAEGAGLVREGESVGSAPVSASVSDKE